MLIFRGTKDYAVVDYADITFQLSSDTIHFPLEDVLTDGQPKQ